jgi:hypothetical protein
MSKQAKQAAIEPTKCDVGDGDGDEEAPPVLDMTAVTYVGYAVTCLAVWDAAP